MFYTTDYHIVTIANHMIPVNKHNDSGSSSGIQYFFYRTSVIHTTGTLGVQ